MSANGYLQADELAPIPGSNSQLRNDAAAAYTALHYASLKKYGVSMALDSGSVGRSYRSYAMQVEAKRVYGSDAAEPGTSNHGLGINVDLQTPQQRWVIDQIGAQYGFSKSWSDASWEWWHITYQPGHYNPPPPFIVLKHGSNGKRVRWVQWRLRVYGYDVPKKGTKFHGHFGEATKKAVKAFQERKNLTADGRVGPATWKALKSDPKSKKKGSKR